ncbi:MAG: hypothetical protein U5K00_02250 [Melioribacteraceae bacterium]|nr:hypothetical protein [Melioribacteraceae bacterium]
MAVCKSCKKEIYFLKTKNGKYIPVNAESLTVREKEDLKNNMKRIYKPGFHVSHFADCPEAIQS